MSALVRVCASCREAGLLTPEQARAVAESRNTDAPCAPHHAETMARVRALRESRVWPFIPERRGQR